MLPSWCVARFMSGFELQAAKVIASDAHGIEDNLRAFCPLHRREWVHHGTKHNRLFPMLIGYVFIEMMRLDAFRWHDVAKQKGFLGFIGGAIPDPIRPHLIERLIDGASDEWEITLDPREEDTPIFNRGDLFRVRGGPCEALRGHVEWVEPNGREAWVTLQGLFNRGSHTKIDLSLLDPLERPRRKKPFTLADLPVREAQAVLALA